MNSKNDNKWWQERQLDDATTLLAHAERLTQAAKALERNVVLERELDDLKAKYRKLQDDTLAGARLTSARTLEAALAGAFTGPKDATGKMRKAVLARLAEIKQQEHGFQSGYRWGFRKKKGWDNESFVIGGQHISEMDFAELSDEALVLIFERVASRLMRQM